MQNDKAKCKSELKKRVYRWILRLIAFLDALPKDAASRTIVSQILRSGTSIGANKSSLFLALLEITLKPKPLPQERTSQIFFNMPASPQTKASFGWPFYAIRKEAIRKKFRNCSQNSLKSPTFSAQVSLPRKENVPNFYLLPCTSSTLPPQHTRLARKFNLPFDFLR